MDSSQQRVETRVERTPLSALEKIESGQPIEILFNPEQGLEVTLDSEVLVVREVHLVLTTHTGAVVKLRLLNRTSKIEEWHEYVITAPVIWATVRAGDQNAT